MAERNDNRITLRALLVGTLFAAVFAVLTVFFENHRRMLPTANQIPVFPYVLLFATVLIINPVCRLIRVVRRFTSTEVLVIFMMGMVSSGVSTFGLTAQLVPVVGSLFNRYWNNDQTEWNQYVEPFLHDYFFLAEPGIRDAAGAYRDSLVAPRELRRVHEAAVAYKRWRSQNGDEEQPLTQERLRSDPALPTWAKPLCEDGVPAIEEVLDRYPAKIADAEAVVKTKKDALRELETRAFERVATFRRGLPRGKRAVPGFIFVPGQDDPGSYVRRLRRLLCGRRSARHLQDALRRLDRLPTGTPMPGSIRDAVEQNVRNASKELAEATDATALEERREEFRRLDDALAASIVELDKRLVILNEERRLTTIERSRELEDEVEELREERDDLVQDRTELERGSERLLLQLDATERAVSVRAGINDLAERLGADDEGDHQVIRGEVDGLLERFSEFDGALRRYLLGDIPWSHWWRPLVNWGLLIGLTYVVLMTFNVLVFRQWAYHEKLIYPLAQLPEILAGRGGEGDDGIVPEVFRDALFWCGFAISASVLGWNLLCRSEWLPGLHSLDLVNSWGPYIRNSAFKGLLYGARSSVFFTMIGIAFLIPKKVSFSMWFFWVFYMVQLLLMVWTGHGQNESSFPSEWWYTLNFRTAEGGGALLVFASVVLFKCRKYFLCALFPRAVAELPADERMELRVSSMLFLFGTVGLLLVLWLRMGVNLWYATFVYAVMMVITIGLVRAVSEGGVMGFQAKVGPFHLIRHIVGYDKSWTAPHLFAPLLVYYSILFLDIKTCIAPAMANSLKLRDDLRLKRGRFHLAIAVCIAAAVMAAILTALMMCYSSGANSMHSWFYTTFPRSLFTRIAEMSKSPPTPTAAGRTWLAIGGLIMTSLLYFRQHLFWLPHPIGLIMLVNPIMATYWFSIFLGWLANALVTRYGNKDTYTRARGFFIGLIAGELVLVTVAMVVSLILHRGLGIDLNR